MNIGEYLSSQTNYRYHLSYFIHQAPLTFSLAVCTLSKQCIGKDAISHINTESSNETCGLALRIGHNAKIEFTRGPKTKIQRAKTNAQTVFSVLNKKSTTTGYCSTSRRCRSAARSKTFYALARTIIRTVCGRRMRDTAV